MRMNEAREILVEQEQALQFKEFSNQDAWNIGKAIVEEAIERKLKISVSIRLNSGYVIFQQGLNGSNLDNQFWMNRKSNSVVRKEMSSLHLWANLTQSGNTLQNIGMDEKDYALCGGGFPIILQRTGVIGTIMVSGLDHIADHNMIVNHLAKYLQCEITTFEQVEV